jgi:beta-lactamase regulating signal transducer with metallopeptidase domain
VIIYLVTSAILLGLLLGFYKLLLENEKMHRFNRYFLIFAIVFGLSAPLISFEFTPETTSTIAKIQEMGSVVNAPAEAVSKSIEPLILPKTDNLHTAVVNPTTPGEPTQSISRLDVLIGIYGLITLFLLIRFVAGLIEIRRKVKEGVHKKIEHATLVLLNESITPQSFFTFIFLDKEQFELGKIEAEILDHELTHVRQMHSLDVLFIEFLKVIFWFNPLMHLYKYAIQLNHEFLADESVVSSGSSVTDYQNMLIRVCAGNKSMSPTSSFNYPLTKKRFRMMSSTKSIWRTLPIILITISVTLMLAIVSCSDTKTIPESYTAEELYEMFPTVRYDIELESVARTGLYHPLDKRSGYVVGPDGEPYTGEQNVYSIKTDRHAQKHIYVDGILRQTEHYFYDEDGEFHGKGVSEKSLDANGNRVTKFFSDRDSDTLFLWLERIEEDSLIAQNFYHQNGQLLRSDAYLREYDSSGLLYHGLKSEYDENGNLTSQERYERGELIEKIK